MDKSWKNKIVHLSAIHSITFESATNLSPTGKQCFFIAKRNSSSYNIVSMSNWEKAPFLPSKSITFIQKGEMVGLPKVTFGLPNSSFPNAWLFSNVFYKMLHITKSDQSFTRRVPLGHLEISSIPKLQRQCPQMHKALKTEYLSQT